MITCVVFPEPVSPETSDTWWLLMVAMISCLMWYTGSVWRNWFSSDSPRLGGTCGTPLFSRPVVVLLNSRVTGNKKELLRDYGTPLFSWPIVVELLRHWQEKETINELVITAHHGYAGRLSSCWTPMSLAKKRGESDYGTPLLSWPFAILFNSHVTGKKKWTTEWLWHTVV